MLLPHSLLSLVLDSCGCTRLCVHARASVLAGRACQAADSHSPVCSETHARARTHTHRDESNLLVSAVYRPRSVVPEMFNYEERECSEEEPSLRKGTQGLTHSTRHKVR